MRRRPNRITTQTTFVGDLTFRGTPKKLVEDLDRMGLEASSEGDLTKAHMFWQKSEYFKKEFDINRIS